MPGPLFLKRTDSTDIDFGYLANLLKEELRVRDGALADFYESLNKATLLPYVVVAYQQELVVSSGALRPFDENCWELKRMFVKEDKRGLGIAAAVLKELENWCLELRGNRIILETGRNQPEAISFYQKQGYSNIPVYGRYQGAANSICFEKLINHT